MIDEKRPVAGLSGALKGKLKEMGEGFISGASGGVVSGFRAPEAQADTGVQEAGKQSPSTGDTGKDTVNAIRDLQSDFNGQGTSLKSINSNLSAQLGALGDISKQLGDLTKAVKNINTGDQSGGGPDLTDLLGGLGGRGGGKQPPKPPQPTSKPGAAGKAARVGGVLAKGGAGVLGKLIPGVGLGMGALGAYEAYQRGDYTGMLLQGGAGLASLVPGAGTALSAALSGADLLRGAENKIEEFAPGEKEALIAKQEADKKAQLINQSTPEYDAMGNNLGPTFKEPVAESLQAVHTPTAVDTPAMIALAAKQKEQSEEANKNTISFTAKEMIFKADSIRFQSSGGGAATSAAPVQQPSVTPNAAPSVLPPPAELGGPAGGGGALPQVPGVPPELGGPQPGGGPGGQGGGDQTEQILATIRKRESGGNYQAQSRDSTASGAYQFINSTWQSLAKKFNIGTEYRSAKDAPKEVQDAVAKAYVQDILKKTGGDVSKVPIVWYTGNVEGKMSANALAVNKGMTPEAYQSKWMSDFGKMGGGQQAAAGGGGGAPMPSGGGMSAASSSGGGGGIPSAAPPPVTPGAGATSESAMASQERAGSRPEGAMQAGPTSMSSIASENRDALRQGQNGMLPDSALAPIGIGSHKAQPAAAAAFKAMRQAAAADGVNLGVSGAYRTYQRQVELKREKGRLAATPGKSNHGWGLAFDMDFGSNERSPGFQWMRQNAAKFGFKGPLQNPYEAWHWEYAGGGGAPPSGTTQVAGAELTRPGGGGEGAPPSGSSATTAALTGGEQRQMERSMRGGPGGMGGGSLSAGLGGLGGAIGGMFGGPLGGMLGGMIGGGVGSMISSLTSGPSTGAQAMQKSFETSSYAPPPSQTNIVTGASAQQGPSENTAKPNYETGEPYISAKDLSRIFGITYS